MKFSAKSRFTTIMVVTATLAMLLVGALAWFEGRKSLEHAAYTHLTSTRVAKTRQVEAYFSTMRNQITLMSEDRTVITAMVQLSRGYRRLGQTAVPPKFDTAIQAYYEASFIPKLIENITGGAPEYNVLRPRNYPGRHLQYHYIANRPENAYADSLYGFFDAGDGSDYSRYHKQHHKGFRDFLQSFGYYDVFLIDYDTGEIIYSVAKEVDFGTNLLTGPYRSTGLAEVVRKVRHDPIRGQVHTVDFEPYAPSVNAPASFMAAPIYNGQHVVGILAFQTPVDKIQNIMTGNREWRQEGLGESGETYLVGSDFLMRSDSRFLLEGKAKYLKAIRDTGLRADAVAMIDKMNTSILLQPVETKGAQAAIRGEEGHFVAKDYRGVEVLSTYSKLNISGLDWGIVAEIDSAEAFAPIGRLLKEIIISTAIFIPIVAYLSFLLSQNFLRPVRNLVDTAKDLRKKYEREEHDAADKVQFETGGASEYQELSHEMNLIMDKVRHDMIDTREKKKSFTDVITASLPVSVGERYRSGESDIYDESKRATAVLVQLDNFRQSVGADNLINQSKLQSELDDNINEAARQSGVDLFNQIGMDYLGVCGLTMPYLNHFERVMIFSKMVFKVVADFNDQHDTKLVVNVGIDVGPMTGVLNAGSILDYDVMGEPIYIAKEICYSGTGDAIKISSHVLKYLKSIDLDYGWKKTTTTIDIDGRNITLLQLVGKTVRASKI